MNEIFNGHPVFGDGGRQQNSSYFQQQQAFPYENRGVGAQMVLQNITFTRAKTYKNVAARNFGVYGDYHDLNTLENIVDQSVNRGAPVTQLDITNNIPNLVRIGDEPTAVHISNGWGTTRMRFVMEVETALTQNSFMTTYLQGYTDYEDMTIAGRVDDPNMPIYINSVISTITTMHPTAGPTTRLHSSFNIVVDNFGKSDITAVIDSAFAYRALIRPKDIFESIESEMTYSEYYGDDMSRNQNFGITDTRSMLGVTPQTSTRNNNVSNTYLARSINALAEALTVSSFVSTGAVTTYQNASGATAEMNLKSIPFFNVLSDIEDNGYSVSPVFTLSTLALLFPYVGEKLTYVTNDAAVFDPSASVFDTNDSASLMDITTEARVATSILEAMTTHMSSENISILSFTFTNIVAGGGGPVYITSYVLGLARGLDYSPSAERVRRMFLMYTAPEITYNNQLGVSIQAHIDTLGESVISIDIENGGIYTYRFPSFCDSLYSPVITSVENKQAFVTDMKSVFSSIHN